MGRNLVNQILVVEDDPITQTFYKTIISRVYDSPVIFESAESARESLQTTIFPVMFCLNMVVSLRISVGLIKYLLKP